MLIITKNPDYEKAKILTDGLSPLANLPAPKSNFPTTIELIEAVLNPYGVGKDVVAMFGKGRNDESN